MSDHTVDDYALRCAADALLRHEEPNAVTDEIRRTHGYPLPMRGPTYTRAEVVVRAYVEALNGGRP